MLHRGRMQLLQRNERHRFRVMLDAQVLVNLGCVANVIHTIRISQCPSSAPSPPLVFARLRRLRKRGVVLCLPLFSKLSSIPARKLLPEIALKPRLQPTLSGAHHTSFLPALLKIAFAPWPGIHNRSGSIGNHVSLPRIRQPKSVELIGFPKKSLAVFVEATMLAGAVADQSAPIPEACAAELANPRSAEFWQPK